MAMSRGPGGGGSRFSRRKKFCRFTAEGVKQIDYKDLATLKRWHLQAITAASTDDAIR